MHIDLPRPGSLIELCAGALFLMALLHTFMAKRFRSIALRFESGSVGENFFHLLGEVEVVFGFYAAVFLTLLAAFRSKEEALHYLNSVNFTEPAFVFVIMSIAATRPILNSARWLLRSISGFLPFSKSVAFYFAALTIGPLLGSFITEPAAMTVTALILKEAFYDRKPSQRLMYSTIALLFVNISVGGTLTPFAAPPVLMVAGTWGWDMKFMLENFALKTLLAVLVNAALITGLNFKELKRIAMGGDAAAEPTPLWVTLIHLTFLVGVVVSAHHMVVFVGVFLFFLGVVAVFKEYNDELKLKEALLVAFFLGGLVVLGGEQRWWLEWLLARLDSVELFLGAAALTAVTDNAALTYLGSKAPALAESSRYFLVAGAVAGGGLTVIANAPNPAGYGILSGSFGEAGISPRLLLFWALPLTAIVLLFYGLM